MPMSLKLSSYPPHHGLVSSPSIRGLGTGGSGGRGGGSDWSSDVCSSDLRATAELLIAFYADELEAQLVSAPPRFGVFSIDQGLGNEFCVEDDVPCRIKAVLQNAEYPFLGVGEIGEVLSDREIEIHRGAACNAVDQAQGIAALERQHPGQLIICEERNDSGAADCGEVHIHDKDIVAE